MRPKSDNSDALASIAACCIVVPPLFLGVQFLFATVFWLAWNNAAVPIFNQRHAGYWPVWWLTLGVSALLALIGGRVRGGKSD